MQPFVDSVKISSKDVVFGDSVAGSNVVANWLVNCVPRNSFDIVALCESCCRNRVGRSLLKSRKEYRSDVVADIVDEGRFSVVDDSVNVVCLKVVLDVVASLVSSNLLEISVVGGRGVVDIVDIVDSLDIF